MMGKKILEALLLIGVGGIIGYFLRSVIYNDSAPLQIIKGNKDFPYISQQLDSESVSETTQGQIVITKSRINEYIENEIDQGHATEIAVYYRDLNNGPWMGINEKTGFSPASLLKVPILMAVYKIADDNKAFLATKVLNQVLGDGVTPDFVPSKQMKKGESYTIDELVERMIVYSDNEAKNLILTQMQMSHLEKIYKDLGMVVPGIIALDDTISVRSYASFFRILYNGSYLSRELSNKALKLLTQSEFKDGLVAGIPKDIPIAHKFGERGFADGIKQLHDCGIIYYSENPYILCIMTRGRDWNKLSSSIKNISQIVYEETSQK